MVADNWMHKYLFQVGELIEQDMIDNYNLGKNYLNLVEGKKDLIKKNC